MTFHKNVNKPKQGAQKLPSHLIVMQRKYNTKESTTTIL
jgi:hypothetical protein